MDGVQEVTDGVLEIQACHMVSQVTWECRRLVGGVPEVTGGVLEIKPATG